MRKILVSLSTIGIVSMIAIGATMAYFGDIETSTDNTFTAGSIDLKIDYRCEDDLCEVPFKDLNNDQFFGNCDIKPGDKGEVTISWHISNNKAWGRMRMTDVFDYEYHCTEPEAEVDSTCGPEDPFNPGVDLGELSDFLTFTAWMDEGDVEGWQCWTDQGGCPDDPTEGDNIFNGAYEVKFAENKSVSEFMEGFELPKVLDPNYVYYIGLQWELPSEAGNIIQTDSLMANIVMEAVQYRNNSNPWQ